MFRITEKELFTYIFYPDELSEDIFNYISKNISKFSREIEMLAQLKKILDEEVPENVMAVGQTNARMLCGGDFRPR